MLEHIAMTDLVLSALVLAGMLQLAWFSVMLARRGMNTAHLRNTIPPLLSIWVLMWPVYTDSQWLWLGLAGVTLPALLACWLRLPFWQQLRLVWSSAEVKEATAKGLTLPPFTHFTLALFIAGLWFQAIPEFGFGLALCLCLALPAAYWVDDFGRDKLAKLGFPAHPEQTLAGHLALIIASTIMLAWALHVYHGTDWQSLLIATLLAGMVGSATYALLPGQWNRPACMLSMGAVMWVL